LKTTSIASSVVNKPKLHGSKGLAGASIPSLAGKGMEGPSAMKRQTSGGARLRFQLGSKACTLCSYSGRQGEARTFLSVKLGSKPRETWPSRRCEDCSGQLSTRRETVRLSIWVSVPVLVALLLLGAPTLSRADKKKDVATFGDLEGLSLQ